MKVNKYAWIIFSAVLITTIMPNVIDLNEYSPDEIAFQKQYSSGNMDIVFMVDNTGSMGSQVDLVKTKIVDIVNRLTSMQMLTGSLKLGLVAYRDYEDSWVTKKQNLTDDINIIKSIVNEMIADGGGDTPEAVAEGFLDSINLNWRQDSTKLLIWIADAPPHHKKKIINNKEALYWEPQANNLIEIGVTIHSVVCRGDNSVIPVMEALAKKSNGFVINLDKTETLVDIIIGLSIEGLDRLFIKAHIDQLVNSTSTDLEKNFLDDEERIQNITEELKKKNIQKRNFRMNKEKISVEKAEIEVKDVKFALRSNYKLSESPCELWGILCKFDFQILPAIGLVVEKTKLSLPLTHSHVNAEVYDNIGVIYLNQTYYNYNDENVTASFTFPIPEGAIVSEFTAYIDNRTITGRLLEKSKAQKVYDMAIQKGEDAYLLTDESANVFKFQVGNLPGKAMVVIAVKLISQLMVTDEGIRFALPTKAINLNQKGSSKFYNTKISLMMNATMNTNITACKVISKSNTQPQITINGTMCAIQSDNLDLTQDFVAEFQQENKHHNIMWMSNEKVHELRAGHIVIHPQSHFNSHGIAHAPSITVIVDYSNSLSNNDVAQSIKEILHELLNGLAREYTQYGTFLSVILFNHNVSMILSEELWTKESSEILISKALTEINKFHFNGGTNILQAFQKCNLSKLERPSRIFVITDGKFAAKDEVLSLIYSIPATKDYKTLIFAVGYSPDYEAINQFALLSKSIPEFIHPKESPSQKVTRQIKRGQVSKYSVDYLVIPNTGSKVVYKNEIKNTELDGSRMDLNLLFDNIVNSAELILNVTEISTGKTEILRFDFTPNNKNIIYTEGSNLHIIAGAERVKWLEMKEEVLNENHKEEIVSLCEKLNVTSKYTSFVATNENIYDEALSHEEESPVIGGKVGSSIGGGAGFHRKTRMMKEGHHEKRSMDISESYHLETVSLTATPPSSYAMMEDESAIRDLILIDVTPLSYGFVASNGEYIIVVPKETVIPARKSHRINLIPDKEPTIIKIYTGEEKIAKLNFYIDEIIISLDKETLVEIEFDIDENSVLTITITNVLSGEVLNKTIISKIEVTKEQIEQHLFNARKKIDL